MAKKTEKEVEAVIEKVVEKVLAPITPITQDFAREDLNLLRNKINEVISKING